MTVSLILVGFGHVARRFVTLLEESRAELTALGIDPKVVAIATRRHGCAMDSAGLDAVRAAKVVADAGALGPAIPTSTLNFLSQLPRPAAEARVLVETTTLEIQSGEPAISHVRAGFAMGADVITANKGPVAFAYRALSQEAAAAGRSFLFEGAVMDGLPIFNLVRETMPAARILGFRGVINSTTNHILTAIERGEPFDRALARMQAAGVAEADPSLDLDGWDAAAKCAALSNVWLGANTTPRDIPRATIGPDIAPRVVAALRKTRRLKLVAKADGHGANVRPRVDLEELEPDDPLAQLDGQSNALEIDTWPLGRMVITQRDGGLEKTAYALLTDLVTAATRAAKPAKR